MSHPSAHIGELLNWGRSQLANSPSAALDALVILESASGVTREQVLAHPERALDAEQQDSYASLIIRRRAGEPVAHLLGLKEFWGLEFAVSSATLVPRPETELLVEHALRKLKELPQPAKILELGAGSGCIAVAIAVSIRELGCACEITALERSPAAAIVARQNVERHRVSSFVQVLEADWTEWSAPIGGFDLLLSNPPYLKQGETNRSPETNFEPPGALFSGPTGLEDVSWIVSALPKLLRKNGLAFIEIGADQGEAVKEIVSQSNYYSARLHLDLSGASRLIEVQSAPCA